ncbi:glycosyl transferase family 2 [Salegentibacter sp. 24]|uniref:glycosyltransferase family 2 protein n=1 Tax=Salegentibacter sp. 24 TaxID=2183986 RepID=UPI00105C0CD6|nr:glycosyltransferase family 2 protein [Salegentibacter sp. 24]TDN88683.1 glycosyl transferase family 2 [Salegentibacter sp. 24]
MAKVSIIIPTFNRAHIIAETLDSIQNQTFQNWECIIIDDGSQDNTSELIGKYVETDQRFHYILRKEYQKKGASSCRNIGLRNSSGKYIQFLDSDDIIENNKLAKQVEILDKKKSLTFSTCKWGRISNSGEIKIKHQSLSTYFSTSRPFELLNIFGNCATYLPIHTFLFHKDLINTSGYWNETLTNNDDGEFITRICINSEGMYFTSETIVYYRTGEQNRLSNLNESKNISSFIEAWNIIDKTIYSHTSIKNHTSVKNAKRDLYLKLSSKNILTKQQKAFCKNRRLYVSSLLLKVLTKLRLWKLLRKFSF